MQTTAKKTAILEAATRLFAARGFRETSTPELARMTGSAEGTIFYHFGNKDALFLAVLKTIRDEILNEFSQFLDEHKTLSGLAMLEELIVYYLHLATAKKEQFLLLHRSYAYELASVNKACREHLEAIYDCLVEVFERAIRIGQNDGSIGDVDVRKTAFLIFTMVDGLVRLRDHNLYDAGSLYGELVLACRRMVLANNPE
jgi:AcrR family transcriptional regulator